MPQQKSSAIDPWAALFEFGMKSREVFPDNKDAKTADELDVLWCVGHGKGERLRKQLIADGMLKIFHGKIFKDGRMQNQIWYYPSHESKTQKLVG